MFTLLFLKDEMKLYENRNAQKRNCFGIVPMLTTHTHREKK